MRYRKKPVEIEAIQYMGKGVFAAEGNLPHWLYTALEDGTVSEKNGVCYIRTMEGIMTVSEGNWVIRGIHGEVYSCAPEIFEATYEKLS